MNTYTQFSARWEPAPYLAPKMPVTSGKNESYYYSPYGGWNSCNVPILFASPAVAAGRFMAMAVMVGSDGGGDSCLIAVAMAVAAGTLMAMALMAGSDGGGHCWLWRRDY